MGKAIKKGIKKIGGLAKDFYDSSLGRATTYAVLGALTGGLGAAGAAALGATVSATAAGITMATTAAAGATSGYQSASMEKSQKEAQWAEERAQEEQDILRKQALLASEKSLQARQSTASAVSNRLKNTSTGILGDEEEKLGG